MNAIEGATATLQALDLAIRYAAAISLDWEGAAADSARARLELKVSEMVWLRAQVLEVREQALAVQAEYYARMGAAFAGL
ncbi:MAG: hypothetical protein Q4E01_00690 [Actinomycetaceae bacterium]|nr:hypothetical protein [Actinomycetaceae bacterium]